LFITLQLYITSLQVLSLINLVDLEEFALGGRQAQKISFWDLPPDFGAFLGEIVFCWKWIFDITSSEQNIAEI